MCDGEQADDCDIITYDEYELLLNSKTSELDEKWSKAFDKLYDIKSACIEKYEKDPRVSHSDKMQQVDDFLSEMLSKIRSFDFVDWKEEQDCEKNKIRDLENSACSSMIEPPLGDELGYLFKMMQQDRDEVICESFSTEFNSNVSVFDNNRTVKCKRSAGNRVHKGYCFLQYDKIETDHWLVWTLQISKFKIGDVGMVIFYDL